MSASFEGTTPGSDTTGQPSACPGVPGAAPPGARLPSVGRYVLLEKIGAGTMGEVFKASDPRIGRVVAVKLLRIPDGLDAAQREEWERRFLLEARAAGRLSHRGIVAVHDVGHADDGRPFIVMEHVDGRGLDAYLKRGKLPAPALVLDWAAQIAEALDHAHRQGIVHRDVKPANILVDHDGRARIADFGIARLADSELTRDGAFLGSPAYAAPEQIRALPIDGRADLFSLAATTYALLTGSRPFQGEDLASLAYAICHVEPAPPRSLRPELGAAVQAVVLKGLAKDPERRHRSGQEMAQELRIAASAATVMDPMESVVTPVEDVGEADSTLVERTLADIAALSPEGPGPERAEAIEHRAAALGSAAAVGCVRAAAAVRSGSRRAGRRAAKEWAVWAPRFVEASKRAAVAILAACRGFVRGVSESWRARPAGTGVLAGIRFAATAWSRAGRAALTRRRVVVASLVLAACAVGGAAWMLVSGSTGAEPRPSSPATRLRSFFHESLRRENTGVRVTHGVEAGQLTIYCDGDKVKETTLAAQRKSFAVAGMKLVSYGRETNEYSLRLPPGRHKLSVAVVSSDKKLNLLRELTVEVAAGERYTLDLSVRSLPWKSLDADWRIAAGKEAS